MDISQKQIMIWSESSIPENWQICDGTNGTPDMRSKFIYGASVNEDLNISGGANSHVHNLPNSSSAGGSHTHSFTISTNVPGGVSRSPGVQKFSYGGHNHSYSGTTSTADNTHYHSSTLSSSISVPPYILLYYIMKVA